MSLDVRHGGVVAVDTEELRAQASAVAHAAEALREAARRGELTNGGIAGLAPPSAWAGDVARAAADAAGLAEEADDLVAGLRHAADVYELVELRALQAMHGPQARLASGALAADRIAQLARGNPDAHDGAEMLWAAWEAMSADEIPAQFDGVIPGITSGLAAALVMGPGLLRGFLGRAPGSLSEPALAEARRGEVPRTAERRVPMSLSGSGWRSEAPTGLADAIRRIPNGERGSRGPGSRPLDRVRVDRYTMPDGARRFAVYITGSRRLPHETDDPFGWSRNLGLYLGQPGSEGYEFVLDALDRAGAEEGDVVDAYGFSQGAMVGQRLATDSGFDVRSVTTIGAPLRVPVGDGTASIALAHDDDPVAALADHGSPAPLGSDESLLISRTSDPARRGALELGIGSHRVSSYAETAEEFERSGDPRAESLRAHFAELRRAVDVESFVFAAPEPHPERVTVEAPGPRGAREGALSGASASSADAG